MTKDLIDPFERRINYLRVSVTDRCDFRCQYCMSEKMTFLPKSEVLSLEELDRICSNFIEMGIKKLRVTGGEPLVRRDIISFLSAVSRHLKTGKLRELTLTTNGSQLVKFAQKLSEIGVKRVNVSLDTLNPEKFREITRRGNLEQVLEGIEEAKSAGISVKINTVAMKGFNDSEMHDLVRWCGEKGFDLAFIEVMPMGESLGQDRLGQYWSIKSLREELAAKWKIEDIDYNSGGPARYVRVNETGGRIGFITPLSHNFCESCNRVRLTCTGQLFMCLGQEDESDLRKIIRSNPQDDGPLKAAIRMAIARKPKGHDFDYSRKKISGEMTRYMSHTGG